MKRKHKRIPVYVCATLALVVVILVTFIIGQNTGQKAVLADAFVDKVSDQVGEQLDQDVTSQIAEKVLEEKLQEIITPEKITEIVSENVKTKLSDAQKQAIVDAVQKNVMSTISNTTLMSADTLSAGQKEQVKKMIKASITNGTNGKDVNSITQEDLSAIQNTIENNLRDSITNIIKSSNLTLSKETIKEIQKNLDLSSVVNNILKESNTVVKEKDLVKLQKEIVNTVKESVKTPVKGVDYLTQDEIDSIQNSAAKSATDRIAAEIEEVKKTVSTISSNVGTMQTQISSLESQLKDMKTNSNGMDGQIATVQTTINTINDQIKLINQNADDLGGKIEIRNSFLRRVTAKNGSIDKAEVVDTSDMTIAQFVGVLSGNEKEYTTAINQLSYSVEQIKSLIGENFKSLSDECASLSSSIDANGDRITTLKEALAAESQKNEESISSVKGSIESNMSDIQKKLEAYKKASQDYADDQSDENKAALADAKRALEDSLTAYKGNLDSLSDQVNGLDNATQSKISNINDQIAAALESIEAGDGTLDEKITQLSGSTASLADALQKAIDKETSDRESGDEQIRNDLGDAADASVIKGDTIFAKLKTLWGKISDVSKKVDDTDQWCDNIVLHNTTGTNDGKDVYYEDIASGTYAGGIRWKVDGNAVGLTNIKETSNINIQYSSTTPDIVCEYEQGTGFFYIYVDPEYKDDALTTNIVIDMVHVESAQ